MTTNSLLVGSFSFHSDISSNLTVWTSVLTSSSPRCIQRSHIAESKRGAVHTNYHNVWMSSEWLWHSSSCYAWGGTMAVAAGRNQTVFGSSATRLHSGWVELILWSCGKSQEWESESVCLCVFMSGCQDDEVQSYAKVFLKWKRSTSNI